MIQLNDLTKELTEVTNSDLGLVVGGGSMWPSNEIRIPISSFLPSQSTQTQIGSGSLGFSYQGNLDNLSVKGLSGSFRSGATTYTADGQGTLGFSTSNGNSSSVSATYNPWSRDISANANFNF